MNKKNVNRNDWDRYQGKHLTTTKEKLDRISFGKVFTTEFFLVFSGFSVILSFIFLEITIFFFGFLFSSVTFGHKNRV